MRATCATTTTLLTRSAPGACQVTLTVTRSPAIVVVRLPLGSDAPGKAALTSVSASPKVPGAFGPAQISPMRAFAMKLASVRYLAVVVCWIAAGLRC